MNQNIVEYALLAGNSYRSSRPSLENRMPVPQGWTELETRRNPSSGFEAVAYQKGSEIVISYAGTNFDDISDLSADALLGLGFTHQQLIDAAAFYKEILRDYGPNITLVGHSLGGGLAATIGVFFNQPAVTFDPAPFRLLATKDNAQIVQASLIERGFAPDGTLAGFTTTGMKKRTATTSSKKAATLFSITKMRVRHTAARLA